jgi:hypothetical protein
MFMNFPQAQVNSKAQELKYLNCVQPVYIRKKIKNPPDLSFPGVDFIE